MAERCKECGLKVRGENHKEGEDHKRRKAEREASTRKAG